MLMLMNVIKMLKNP